LGANLKKRCIFWLVLMEVLLFSNFANANILINEILANGINDPDSEWVELFNDGSADVNLANWNLSETSSKNVTLNADATIPSNGFIILAGDSSAFNSAYPNVNSRGIKIVNITTSSFNLADTGGEVKLYDSSGSLADSIIYTQASGKKFENVSIGRYPDGSLNIFNLTTLTPGAKNDNSKPSVEWLYPNNNTYVNYLVNIVVNIVDDTATIEYAMINFDGTNYSMSSNNNQWSYLWDTSLYEAKPYNMTVFFKDSYGKYYSDKIYNIIINNTEAVSQLNNIPVITLANLTNPDYLNRANGSLKLSWTYNDDDNDAITNQEILWYIDGNENAALRNITSISSASLRKGHAWIASARIFDGKNWSDFYNSSPLTIINSAPAQSDPLVTSSDDKNRKNGTLACSGIVSDPDSDNVVNFIRWYKNGILVASAVDSSTLKRGNFSKNDNIICEATPSDTYSNGTALNSTNFRIMNSAPVLVSRIQDKTLSNSASAIINLMNVFMDLDGDELVYTSKITLNITVSIDNSKKIATLIPDKGFSGTRTIVFTASDGTDSTKSNEIVLTVNPIRQQENKQAAEAKTESLGTLNNDLKENIAESEEPTVITGKAIGSDVVNKTNYGYYIMPILAVLIAGAYFVWKRLLKKGDNL